jgi:2-polyprenyl-6-methoxyphenol hydroxylase-like FAD-dependent oxidoreductase
VTARSAVIVGGGIGGLATALALSRIGWTARVLERAPAVEAVGAGLSLWPNAMRALDVLGVGDAVRDAGLSTTTRGSLREPSGAWLRRVTAEDERIVAVHRADLHHVLAAALPDGVLRTGTEVTGVRECDVDVAVRFEHDGGTGHQHADVVVAADGIDSLVRRSLWRDAGEPVFRGRTVWRGVTEPGSVWPVEESITLGAGEQFGLVPIGGERVYWFLVANAEEDVRYTDEHKEVDRRVGGWHAPIPAVVAATPPAAVLHHDFRDLDPVGDYVRGRTVLLGDAAHAMLPELGQGACQALEDAVTLASCLAGEPELPAALAAYDERRRPRTQAMCRAARQNNALNSADHGIRLGLIRLAARRLPARTWRRLNSKWTRWTPPPLCPPPG